VNSLDFCLVFGSLGDLTPLPQSPQFGKIRFPSANLHGVASAAQSPWWWEMIILDPPPAGSEN
jgi:hypothetical protein